MTLSKSSRWYNNFIETGLSSTQSTILTEYAQKLESHSVPVIFELTHLSHLLGMEIELLERIVTMNDRFYRNFTIPKKSGGIRQIDSPYPKLQYIQKWINSNILKSLETSKNNYAYVEGRSHIDHAKKHLGAKEIYKVDIKDFFHNIHLSKVKKIFLSIGYSQTVSYQLSRLCTLYGYLPQGSPTSPILSNIIMYEIDQFFEKLSDQYNCVYTRYADDLCFSGDNIKTKLIESIKEVLSLNNFELNEKKTKKISGNTRKLITGLVVNKDCLRVPKKLRREDRKNSYYLIKNGIDEFNGVNGELNPLYIDSVIGEASYILQVEPDNHYVKKTMNQLIKLKKCLLIE